MVFSSVQRALSNGTLHGSQVVAYKTLEQKNKHFSWKIVLFISVNTSVYSPESIGVLAEEVNVTFYTDYRMNVASKQQHWMPI